MADTVAAKVLPFRAEYAKSGRAACQACKNTIGLQELRIARMVQSGLFDGFTPRWYHFDCFFRSQCPATVGDVAHFEQLKWEDQEKIRHAMEKFTPGDSEFTVEYAKSARARCYVCENPIHKNEVRCGILDHDSLSASRFAPVYKWLHVDCFATVRDDTRFYHSGMKLPGFRDLEPEDQEMLKEKIPDISKKKRKSEAGEESGEKPAKISKEDEALNEKAKKQNEAMYKIRDQLVAAVNNKLLKKKDLKQFLIYNKQDVPASLEHIFDRLADCLCFGALKRCNVCSTGQLVFRNNGYFCTGYMTEYTRCAHVTDEPERVPFKLPMKEHMHTEWKDIESALPFLKNYKGKVEKRAVPKIEAPSAPAATFALTHVHKHTEGERTNLKPLFHFKVLIDKDVVDDDDEARLKEFGAKILHTTKGHGDIMALVTTKEKFDDKDHPLTQHARKNKFPVVSLDFIKNLKESEYNLVDEVEKTMICGWIKPNQIQPHLLKLNPDFQKETKVRTEDIREKMFYEKEMKKVRMHLKGGAVVDPDSELEDVAHVYKSGDQYYTFVLSRVDADVGENSFYKFQILESDRGKHYWVYRTWGRLGTLIGRDTRRHAEPQESLEAALDMFKFHYKDKTGNEWGQKFVKKPGKYTPMEIDYEPKEEAEKLIPDEKGSKLEIAVQKFICNIFDIENMQQTMVDFELDMEEMPLGKISRAQILNAYKLLSDAMELIQNNKDDEGIRRRMVDATNRFFTLVPHSFGIGEPPILNNVELIKNKLDMLDNLIEIELAYELLVKADKGKKGVSRIDAHYESLKCQIKTMEKNSEPWKIIAKYLQNTHAPTHSEYTLKLLNIYSVERQGENKKFEKFKDTPNHKLLWHGSRSSNYVGILSHGLRVAPKEAPTTGYMFGKGIYFADMVTKSANYCCPRKQDNKPGYLLLCDVVLGDMAELTSCKETLTAPPGGKHSVVGLGTTIPDPDEKCEIFPGTVVPYGKPVASSVKKTDLLYNEYVVYNPDQVNVRFVVEVAFDFKEKGGKRR